MTDLLGTISVMPHYHQVVVQSEDATDLPVVETGTEQVVASTESITVATREERHGDVLIEVHRGAMENPPGTRVFAGELSFTTPRIEIGSPVAGDTVTIDLGRIGWIPIEIYTDPPEAPSRIVVLVP
jgi:hypothetical protein